MTPRKAPSDEQIRDAFTEVGEALQRAVVLSSDRVQSVFEDAVIRGRMTRRDAEDLASSLVALGRDQALELRGEVDALARSLPGRVADVVSDAADAVGDAVAAPRSKRRKRASVQPGAGADVSAEAARLVRKGSPTSKPGPAKAKAKPAGQAKSARRVNGTHAATNGAGAQAATNGHVAVPADAADRPAKELIALAGSLTVTDLRALRSQEASGKQRATVLRAIDAKLKA